MAELALVQKVDLRLALAETDQQLQEALRLYLAPVLLKLASPDAAVRQAVFALIKNTFPRIAAARSLQLPVEALLAQAKGPAATPNGAQPARPGASDVCLYSLLFVSKGVDRMSDDARRQLVPAVIQGMDLAPQMVAARLFSILVKLLQSWRAPENGSTDAENMRSYLFRGADHTEAYLGRVIARFFLLLPSTGSSVVQSPGLSFDQANFFTRDAGVAYKSVADLTATKTRLLEFLKSGFSDSVLVLPLLVASVDPQAAINESASTRLRKLDYELSPSLVDELASLFTGVENSSPPVKDVLQDKILALLYKTDMSAHPRVQQICDLGLSSSYGRLRQTATSFVKKVTSDARASSDTGFNSAIALRLKDSILAEGWPVPSASQTASARSVLSQRELQYETLGEVLRNTPSLWVHDLAYVHFLFDSLQREPADLRSCLQSALSSLSAHLVDLTPEAKASLKNVAKGYLSNPAADANLSACKYISVKFVNVCFPFSDPEARLLCLMGLSDANGPETIDESKRGLDPYLYALASSPSSSHPSTMDALVFPSFSDMVVALNEQVQSGSFPGHISDAIKFALKLLVMSAVEGKSTVVVVDEDWGHRVDKALETDKHVRKLVAAEIYVRSRSDSPMDEKESVSSDAIFLFLQMCFNALADSKDLASVLRILVSMSPQDTVAALGVFVDSILELLRGPGLSDVVTRELCEILAIIVTHPRYDQTQISQIVSKINDFTNGSQILGLAFLISRLFLRERLEVIQPDILLRFLSDLHSWFANAKFYDLCSDAVAQLAIFGVLGPKALDQIPLYDSATKVREFKSLLQPRAKSCHEKSVLALACLELADADCYASTSSELLPIEELVYSTHISKQFDFLFAAGDALSILAGGWECEALQQNLDIQGSTVAYVPKSTGRIGPILSHILEATSMTKPSLRRASCIWLLAMVQHLGHMPQIQNSAAEIHFAFMRFLTDKDEIIQESAARGLSIIYELGDNDLKETLVKGLIRSFTDSNTSSQLAAGTVGHDTQLFEKDVLKTHDSSITTYKDVLNLAQDVGDPSLVYKFMSLAKSNALWSSRKGMAYGLGSVLSKSSLDHMLAKDDKLSHKLIPKLYRYRFDPNSSVSQSMNDIWKSLIRDGAKTVEANFDIILNELLGGMGSREWRTRQASVVALGNLLQTQSADKYDTRLEEIWTLSFRSMDDVKESVRKEGLTLAQSLAKSLVRTADLSTGKTSEANATKIVNNLVPFLTGSKGLLSDAEEVRTFALDTVLKLCKLGGRAMQAHVPTLLGQLVELMSTLEPEVVNYLVLNAEKYNLSAHDVDTHRLQSLGHSPLMDGIEKLLGLVNEQILPEVVLELKRAIKKSVGLPSKVCASRVVVQLITGHGFIIKPYGNGLLQACVSQFKDKSSAVTQSFAVAAGYCCKVADIDAVVSYSNKIREMYLGGEDVQSRRLAAVCSEAVGKYCGSDRFDSVSSAFLPLVFIGKHDEEAEVASVFDKAWIENASGVSAVKVYFAEIFEICESGVKSHDYKVRQLVARTIVDLCDSITSFSDKELEFLFNVLLEACKGKSWAGKELVLEALVKLATKNSAYVTAHGDVFGQIEKTVMTEQKRRNVVYQAKAVRVSALFLKVFPSPEVSASYVQVLKTLLSDEYMKEAELVDVEEMDYEKMSDLEAVALEEAHLSYIESVSQAICFNPPNIELLEFLFEAMESFNGSRRPTSWRTCLCFNEVFRTVLQGYSDAIPVSLILANFPLLMAFDEAYKIEKYAVIFVRNCQLLGKVCKETSAPTLLQMHQYLRDLDQTTPSTVVRNEIKTAVNSST